MKDRLIEWYYENTNMVWLGVILVVALILGYAALSDKKMEATSELELNDTVLADNVKLVHDTFSVLSEYQLGYVNNNHAIEYDLFLKKPLITGGEFQGGLDAFIALAKYKYNTSDGKEFISGIKINLYDRVENYEDGTAPRATVTYMLREEDEKKREEEDEYMEGYDLRWEHTISQTEMPDYSEYSLSQDFREYDTTQYMVYSDKEYELYRKLMVYSALRGSINSGIVSYMVWELGLQTPHMAVFNELHHFVSYAQTYGEITNLYEPKLEELKAKLAIENPRFLAYTETGLIYDNKLQAKQALVKSYREFYLPIYVAEAQRIVKEIGGDEGIEALQEVTELESVTDNSAIEGGYEVDEESMNTEDMTESDIN